MTELQIGELLLDLALLFALSYLLAGLLARIRIPGILAALIVAMTAHYTPLGERLLSPEFKIPLSLLADLGVLFLLFFIGLQINLKEMRRSSGNIIWLTILNTLVPFLMGVGVMLMLGYGWLMAFVIGMTRMPTAEAVIVPILDEFNLIRTRVGTLIIGAGVLDDVIEIFLIALVSVWIGTKTDVSISTPGGIILNVALFIFLAWLTYYWLIPLLGQLLPRRARNLMLLTMIVLFGFGGFSQFAGIGMVVGAITSGILMRPLFKEMGMVGEQVTQSIKSVSYGFLGLIFFFWVGLSADLGAVMQSPALTVLLYLAGTLGKLLGVFTMVPLGKLNVREAWVVGVGLDARLTTEIIVAKLLLDADLIDLKLFTALVAAASITAVTVPVIFSLLIRQWGDELRAADNIPQTK